MARETRAATGNSKPRVFPAAEPAAAAPKKKATKPKANTTAKRAPKATTTKASKPTGVTKPKAAPKKKTPVAKVEGEVKKAIKKVKPTEKKAPAKKAKAAPVKK